MLTRRAFLETTLRAAAAGVALTADGSAIPSWARAASQLATSPARPALPHPDKAPFDHVVVVMVENRSFDHLLGWLPGADGAQAGLAYTDQTGTTYPTYDLAPDFQGCGDRDPDHSWTAGVTQLNGGRTDGFLRSPATRNAGDTFPVGYYTEPSVPVLGALARSYTTLDRYFCSFLGETYPNRFYQHAARTDRDHNGDIPLGTPSPINLTIWDRLAGAGLSGTYYYSNLPFIALFGGRYGSITRNYEGFLADARDGRLPNVAFVDPPFGIPGQEGTSEDYHPHGDIRAGEAFLGEVYKAVRSSPNWDRTVLVVNFDEWGGFYDHVVPPKARDETDPATVVNRRETDGRRPDYTQLGFRVPCIVASPYARPAVVNDGPYEHTSVLRMIEWRWNLEPLTARDASARNLAEVLDLSSARTDLPPVPAPPRMKGGVCGPTSTPAHPPSTVSAAAAGPLGGYRPPPAPAPRGPSGGGSGAAVPLAAGAAVVAAGAGAAAASRRRSKRPTESARQDEGQLP